ncbi:efflux transporter periplasmic adaptor subunit [Shewanella sp. UCD-FRSSP16_17]|uniref:efflux RND transporter periplasmic adaptor subunit n=1 Tax=Shewanella sp. UCD-FRSSP16_17 TaxID=1853256 RepID=UPI0007EEBD69|nr:efflux RND transporter periplasmic adaptor subunit [Shewanella sp. UCD-FRSSP16_17]OBT11519.1 efflux transporter periplasmic adaptor subunit [Shewanella sp. UCD-FRSSP16_17]
MATAKQILFPLGIIGVGLLISGVFISMQKPPEEKPPIDNTPLVSIEKIQYQPMTFTVSSYGVVNAKYHTEIVAQVSGEITYLSDNFVKGGFIKKGDVLARIDPSDYESALLDAQANLASAKATLVQEKANAQVAEREWAEITDSKPSDLSLRKPQLAQEIAKLKSAEAGLLRAKRNLERAIIKAPYDALIGSRNIGLGTYVSNGASIGLVYSTDKAEVRLPLADKEMQYLDRKGANAEVKLVGNFAGEKQEWIGTIVRSEGIIDSKSRMTYLVAEVDDPYGLKGEHKELRYGTYVTAHIGGTHAGEVAVVPRHLIVNGLVATMDKENKLRYLPVNIIRQDGSNVIISSGLENGMNIITSALDYPVEGMSVALPQDKVLQTEPTIGVNSDTAVAMEDKE